MSAENRPETKEEIESDLKTFLTTISPIIQLTQSTSNTMLLLPRLLKKINDPDFVDFKKLGPLLEKYSYLINE